MFLNILVVIIGKCTRALSRRSVRLEHFSQDFFSQFIDKKDDSFVRRVFAFSIPIAMFTLVLAAISMSFAALLNDKDRVPAYQIPSRTFAIIQDSTYTGKFTHPNLFAERKSQKYSSNNVATPLACSSQDEMSTLVDSTSSQTVVFHDVATTEVRGTPYNVACHDFTKELFQYLQSQGVSPSYQQRVAIARKLLFIDYGGGQIDDRILLTRIKASTTPLLQVRLDNKRN